MEPETTRGYQGGEQRLTEQELLCIQQLLDAETLALKKTLQYADEAEDEDARDLFHELADIHHRRVDMMLALLDAKGDITQHAKQLLQSEGGDYGHGDL